MHRSEEATEQICGRCGAVAIPARDRGFLLPNGTLLCYDCALARGGEYDDRIDSWVVPPRPA